jgi:hypothetical protein
VRKMLEAGGLAIGLLVTGCANNGARPATTAAANVLRDQTTSAPVASEPAVVVEKGNFTLYVSNQSFEKPTMLIAVTIDGHQVVSDDFQVGNQHQFLRFALNLAAGPRRVVARAGDGTTVEATFRMPDDGERWGVLTFWASAAYYSPMLQWRFFDEEPHFA